MAGSIRGVMANELYKTLITEFLTAAGGETGETVTDSDVVEFVYEDFVVHVCPHPDESLLLIEVQIFQCDLDDAKEAFPRLLILHKLNAVARFTNQTVAFIDSDDMLTVSRTFRLNELDGDKLAGSIDTLLEQAASLQKAWETLQSPELKAPGELLGEASEASASELETHRRIGELT